MGFNPLSIVRSALSSVVGSIPLIGPLAKDLLDNLDIEIAKMSPEQKLAFEKAQKDHELEMTRVIIQDSADVRKLAMAELEHPGIKWIRPGILAGIFLMIVFWVVIAPLIEGITGIVVPTPEMDALPDQLWWFFGSAYLGYGTMREIGKHNKLKAGK